MPRRAKLHLKQSRMAVIPSEARNLLFPATRHSPLATLFLLLTSLLSCVLISCSGPTKFDPTSLTFLIEANPVNLDPRFATDGQSQRLDGLIFSGLLARDAQMNLHGDLAESWQTPDPVTYIFHLKPNIHFHDGRPLSSADVKSTFDFILNAANKSPKRGGFRMIDKIEAPDPLTVIFYLKEPYASLLWNLIPSAAGIVPANAATGIVNLIYLPMSFLSGLWMPLRFMPHWLQGFAPFLPTYHLSQLMLHIFGYADSMSLAAHWNALIGFTLLMLGLSWLIFHRKEQNA